MRALVTGRIFPRVSVAVALAFLVGQIPGCTADPEPDPPDGNEPPGDTLPAVPEKLPGAVASVSADELYTEPFYGEEEEEKEEEEKEEPVLDTGIERGDIYRVLDTDAILNLNRPRGLQRVNLVDANLQRANLRGANLQRANLQRAIYSDDIWWPEGFDAAGAGARQSQVPAS